MSSASGYQELADFAAWYSGIHGYVATVVCAFGVVSNMANIVVLTRRSMITSTNIILTWLAAADLLTMACFLPFGGHFYIARGYIPEVPFPATQSVWWIRYFVFYINFSVVCHTVAVWLTITLAIFRYLCICFPTNASTLCSMHRAKMAVLVVYVASVVICLPNYMVIDVVPRNHTNEQSPPMSDNLQSTNYNVTSLVSPFKSQPIVIDDVTESYDISLLSLESPFNGSLEYYTIQDKDPEAKLSKFNFWIQALFIKLIPCFLLTALTIILIVAMHDANVRRMKLKSQGRRDESERAREHNRTTAMLLAVVGLFQIVELPHGVLTLCSIFVPKFHTEVYTALGDVIDIMALLNNSINFVLYCTMSRLFRDQFVETFFGCKTSSSLSSQPSTKNTSTSEGWMKLRMLQAVASGSPAGTSNTNDREKAIAPNGTGGSDEKCRSTNC